MTIAGVRERIAQPAQRAREVATSSAESPLSSLRWLARCTSSGVAATLMSGLLDVEGTAVDIARTRAERLRHLHRDPAILVLVNAWDVASARAVAGQPGCAAVATASHAIAAAYGFEDGEHIPVDLMLDAVGRIAAAVDVPVTADLEAGYGDVDRTVRTAVQAGVVGANIEDQLRPVAEAAALMASAVRAAEAEGVPLVLNARTDAYLRAEETATEAVTARGKAYLDAGATCFFVPGCTDLATLTSLVEVLGPGRVSAMWQPGGPSPAELEAIGVARVSFGPYAQRYALAQLEAATRAALAGEGLPGSSRAWSA